MSWTIVAGLQPWSLYFIDDTPAYNGNFSPEQIAQLKERGVVLAESDKAPPAHLDLIPAVVHHLSPEQLDNDWAKREAQMRGPDPMAMMPPPAPPPPPKNPLDPEAVKAAVTAGK